MDHTISAKALGSNNQASPDVIFKYNLHYFCKILILFLHVLPIEQALKDFQSNISLAPAKEKVKYVLQTKTDFQTMDMNKRYGNTI